MPYGPLNQFEEQLLAQQAVQELLGNSPIGGPIGQPGPELFAQQLARPGAANPAARKASATEVVSPLGGQTPGMPAATAGGFSHNPLQSNPYQSFAGTLEDIVKRLYLAGRGPRNYSQYQTAGP